MRALALVVLLAACGSSSSTQGEPCTQDGECGGGNVCAANDFCDSSGDVRSVRIEWTIAGAPASATTCSAIPNLDLYFLPADNSQVSFGYAPVPCAEGVFTELKLPNIYTEVQLLDDVTQDFLGEGTIDSTSTVSVDLTP